MGDAAVQCRGGGGGGGEGGGMRTVECLRGRLLAERVASKAAKEEADHLAKRLDELEKKLSDEVKIRNKAERKLRIAIKKLESLKILDVDISDSSIGSLSSNGIPVDHAPEMNNPGSLSSVDSVSSGPRGEAKGWDGDGDSARDSSAGSCTQVNSGSSQEGSWCSVVSGESRSGHCKEEENRMEPEDAMNCGSVEEGAGDHDSEREHQPVHVASDDGSSKSEDNYRDVDDDRLALVLVDPQLSAEAADQSRTEGNDAQAEKVEDHKEEDEEEENNELAIVLVEPQHPQASAKEPGSRSDVQSVLLALRQVKEQLRYTIERRSELVAHRELCGH